MGIMFFMRLKMTHIYHMNGNKKYNIFQLHNCIFEPASILFEAGFFVRSVLQSVAILSTSYRRAIYH